MLFRNFCCVKSTWNFTNKNPQNIHPTIINNCWSGMQILTYTKFLAPNDTIVGGKRSTYENK